MLAQMAEAEAAGFEDSDAEAKRLVNRLKRALGVNADPRAALAELDTVLASEPARRAAYARRQR